MAVDGKGLRRRRVKTDVRIAEMRLDGLLEVGGPAIVQEEQPWPDTPKRRSAEFIRSGHALVDAICQRRSHVVQSKVGEGRKAPVVQAGDIGGSRGQRLRVAENAAHSTIG